MSKKRYIKDSRGTTVSVTTDTLGLEKPLLNENYDIDVHNRNMDKIDEDLKPIDDSYIIELFSHDGDVLSPRDYYTRDEADAKYSTKEELNNVSNKANEALTKANEAFLRGDNVKTQLVDRLISEGLDVSTNNSFEELINNISAIGELKTAYGNMTVSSGNYVSMTITGLNFTPFIVITRTGAVYGNTDLYDATLCIGQICDDYPSSLIYTLGNSNKYSDSYVNGNTYYMKYGGFKAPIYKSMGSITNGAWFAIGI